MADDDKVLSDDEVDALNSAVEDGDVSTESIGDSGEVDIHDFSTQERIVRTQYPVLGRIYERFSKMLVADLYSLIQREAEINADEIQVMKFGEFAASLGMPSAINIIRCQPLRGKACIVMDADLVFAFIENYFGGDCRYQSNIAEREFTLTEQRIVNLIMRMVESNMVDAWQPIMKLEIQDAGNEMNPQLLNIAGPDDLMVSARFVLRFEEIEGALSVILPYTMLEPIRDQLDVGVGRSDDEVDPNWIHSLREEVMDAELEMNAMLTETELTLREVVKMKKGDIIPVELPEFVTLNIEEVPTFTAKYGLSQDKCALKIINRINR